jgi:GAF domain-containing protein
VIGENGPVAEGQTREGKLSRALVDLADTLVADFDVVELLTLLADRCVDVLDVAAAGLMLVDPGGDLRVMASSSEAMRLLELFELQSQEGPCLDCFRTGHAVINQDLATAGTRWPRFAAEAVAAGFRSVHAIPMRLRGTIIGALNLFNIAAGDLRDDDVHAAQALADIATIAVLQHQATIEAQVLNEQLSSALNTRVVIEQAKGMIAERRHLPMDQAFAVLRAHARNRNLRLADVAQSVIDGSTEVGSLDALG